MIEVTIKGFQSVEEVSFSMDGFTALVGRSNIGKSAVVRAVQAALTNALGTDFVRHGSYCSRRTRGTKKCRCQCSVHLKTDGFDLLWEKGDEVNQYTYNGQVYSRVDRGLPDFLVKDFSQVKLGNDKRLIQVADQFAPIFLLNQSGLVVADVLSDVAKLDDIHTAMSDVDSDKREATSLLRVREKDVVDLTASLVWFEGLDAPVDRVKQVSKKHVALQVVERQHLELERFYEKFLDLATIVRALQPVDAVVVPEPEPLVSVEAALTKLLAYEASMADHIAAVAALEPVDLVLDPDATSLAGEESLYGKLHAWVDQIEAFKLEVAGWKAIEQAPDLPDDAFQSVPQLFQLLEFVEQYQVLSKDVDGLESLEFVPDVGDPGQGVNDLTLLNSLTDKHDGLSSDLARLDKDLVDLEGEEQACKEGWTALGVCPTCSQSITEGHVLHLDA